MSSPAILASALLWVLATLAQYGGASGNLASRSPVFKEIPTCWITNAKTMVRALQSWVESETETNRLKKEVAALRAELAQLKYGSTSNPGVLATAEPANRVNELAQAVEADDAPRMVTRQSGLSLPGAVTPYVVMKPADSKGFAPQTDWVPPVLITTPVSNPGSTAPAPTVLPNAVGQSAPVPYASPAASACPPGTVPSYAQPAAQPAYGYSVTPYAMQAPPRTVCTCFEPYPSYPSYPYGQVQRVTYFSGNAGPQGYSAPVYATPAVYGPNPAYGSPMAYGSAAFYSPPMPPYGPVMAYGQGTAPFAYPQTYAMPAPWGYPGVDTTYSQPFACVPAPSVCPPGTVRVSSANSPNASDNTPVCVPIPASYYQPASPDTAKGAPQAKTVSATDEQKLSKLIEKVEALERRLDQSALANPTIYYPNTPGQFSPYFYPQYPGFAAYAAYPQVSVACIPPVSPPIYAQPNPSAQPPTVTGPWR